jgi:hypothetical protein
VAWETGGWHPCLLAQVHSDNGSPLSDSIELLLNPAESRTVFPTLGNAANDFLRRSSAALPRDPLAGSEQVSLSLFFKQQVKSLAMTASTAKLPDSDPIMERLEDQLAWYDRKSIANQRDYRRIKVVVIVEGASFLYSRKKR